MTGSPCQAKEGIVHPIEVSQIVVTAICEEDGISTFQAPIALIGVHLFQVSRGCKSPRPFSLHRKDSLSRR